MIDSKKEEEKKEKRKQLTKLLSLSQSTDDQQKLTSFLGSIHLYHDSRLMNSNYAFIALKGNEVDGHDFIPQIFKKASCIIANKSYQKKIQKNKNFEEYKKKIIFVKDTRKILSSLACVFYNHPSGKLKVVGITGTNGKTSVSLILEKLYRVVKKTCGIGVIGTIDVHYNYFLSSHNKDKKFSKKPSKTVKIPTANTTPISLDLQRILAEMAQRSVEVVIMEISSHALQLKRVAGVEFDSMIFTNLSLDHLDFHKTMKNYFLAKFKLYQLLVKSSKKNKIAITCWDSFVSSESLSFNPQKKIKSFFKKDKKITSIYYQNKNSISEKAHNFNTTEEYFYCYEMNIKNNSASNYSSEYILEKSISEQALAKKSALSKNTLDSFFKDKQDNRKNSFLAHTNLIGDHNGQNITAALLEIFHRELEEKKLAKKNFDKKEVLNFRKNVQKAFSQIAISGRLEVINSPVSEFSKTRKVIIDYAHSPDALKHALKTLKKVTPKRLICLLGCGGDRDTSKRKMMGRVGSQYADISIITSDNPRSESPEKIIEDILEGVDLSKKYFVCVDRQKAIEKGIRMLKKGDVLLIAGKGHEQRQIVKDKSIPFNEKKIVLSAIDKIKKD